MGSVKVVAPEKGKVKFVHQLNSDGSPYAKDVTIEAQPGVDPSRVDWTQQNGQIGILSWGFSRSEVEGLLFPEEEGS